MIWCRPIEKWKWAGSWNYWYMAWLNCFDLDWSLPYEKGSCKIDPSMLINDPNRNRVATLKELLAFFSHNFTFLRRFIIVNKKWHHHNTFETRQQSKQWVSQGKSAPKKTKVDISVNIVIAKVYYEARGIIHIEYFQKRRIINSDLRLTYQTSLRTVWKQRLQLSMK